AFINELADFCEIANADVQEVAKGMGLDKRIGSKFLHAGPGYGGSCFPKDTAALAQSAQDFQCNLSIVDAVIESNDRRKQNMVKKIINALGGTVANKKLAVLGLTFKPNTDDMRESPSLDIIPGLQNAGASISAYDPEGMKEAEQLFKEVEFKNDPYETMTDADAVVIITEWNVFRALDLERVKSLLKKPKMVDLRNIYTLKEMQNAGFDYTSIGRTQKAKSVLCSVESEKMAG
ncbi:MAG: UDP-glucose/GDP-mannose dehydrogenase family protein, partial [Caedimonadaceae bacterium]